MTPRAESLLNTMILQHAKTGSICPDLALEFYWESQFERIVSDLQKPLWGKTKTRSFSKYGAHKAARTFIDSMVFAKILPTGVDDVNRQLGLVKGKGS